MMKTEDHGGEVQQPTRSMRMTQNIGQLDPRSTQPEDRRIRGTLVLVSKQSQDAISITPSIRQSLENQDHSRITWNLPIVWQQSCSRCTVHRLTAQIHRTHQRSIQFTDPQPPLGEF